MNGLQSQPAWRSPFSNPKLCETRSFTWNLNSEFSHNCGFLNYQRFKFEAGHSIGHPSKWSLFLISCNQVQIEPSETPKPKERLDDADFLGLFLDQIDPDGLEDIQQDDSVAEFVVRCNIEILNSEGGLVASRDVETSPREKVSKDYWGWRKVSPVWHSCRSESKTELRQSVTKLRITFSIVGSRKDLLTKIPSSDLNLLAQEQDSEREVAMIFYTFAISGKTDPDFIIETEDDRKFMVHKDILSARSPVFRRMFETTMTESFLGTALVDDISSETLTCVLRHLYTGQVEQEWLNCPKIASELVYASEKYWLSSLRSYCDRHLVRAATIKNCLQLMELANLYDLEVAAEELSIFVQNKMIRSRSNSGASRDSGDEDFLNNGYKN